MRIDEEWRMVLACLQPPMQHPWQVMDLTVLRRAVAKMSWGILSSQGVKRPIFESVVFKR